MSAPTMSLGSLRVAHARLWIPWSGRWSADVDVDLDKTRAVPTGAQTLTIGAATLAGTVDPDRSGRFGEKSTLRLLGGGGGWQRMVAERQFHNDAGVQSSDVLNATASEIGERVTDTAPVRLGVDYVRGAGPAADVLTGLAWYVDLAGTTVVGARPLTPAAKTVEVLSWDAAQQKADIACDEVLLPGTTITDDRFGTIVVRDVEQEFTDGAARATAFCGGPASRIVGALAGFVRRQSGSLFLASYSYRIVEEGVDGRLKLQAVDRTIGLPDVVYIDVWPGMAGMSATYKPATECLVEFIAGDRTRPVVTSFQSDGESIPVQVTIAASSAVNIGGAGATPLALANEVDGRLVALKNVFQTWTPVPNDGGAALKALLKTLLATGWPASVAAQKANGV